MISWFMRWNPEPGSVSAGPAWDSLSLSPCSSAAPVCMGMFSLSLKINKYTLQNKTKILPTFQDHSIMQSIHSGLLILKAMCLNSGSVRRFAHTLRKDPCSCEVACGSVALNWSLLLLLNIVMPTLRFRFLQKILVYIGRNTKGMQEMLNLCRTHSKCSICLFWLNSHRD